MTAREKIEAETRNFVDQSSGLRNEVSELETRVEKKRQRFLDAEADMEAVDNLCDILAEILRGKGIEPPERD